MTTKTQEIANIVFSSAIEEMPRVSGVDAATLTCKEA